LGWHVQRLAGSGSSRSSRRWGTRGRIRETARCGQPTMSTYPPAWGCETQLEVGRPAGMTGEDTTADVRERVLTVLTAIEWAAQADHPDGGWYACCPWCEGGDPDDEETPPGHAGHAELCELAAVIAL